MDETIKGVKIGFGITGSFCTIKKVLAVMAELADMGADIYPILSPAVANTDTRFGTAKEIYDAIQDISGKKPMTALTDVEPIGPKKLIDVLVIAPCTGNSISKLANGISDTAVCLAAKSHLRNNKPIVVAVSTNDGLSGSARNIGTLLSRKNIYIVPFGQDNYSEKENSLVSDFKLIPKSVEAAQKGIQLQPILI